MLRYNQPLSLKRLRIDNGLIVAAFIAILIGSALKTPLARLPVVLAGGAGLAWSLIDLRLYARCPCCGAALHIHLMTLLDGETTYCPRCGEGVAFQ